MARGILILGAGQAGLQAALSLRDEGLTAPVTLAGDEGFAPYQRPPLPKTFLTGDAVPESLFLKREAQLAERGITLRPDAQAIAIDRAARAVVFADGGELAYDRLILATGTRNRVLHVDGADLPGVLALRDLRDALALRVALEGAASVAIVGGGFIVLEVAALCRKLGKAVALVEAADRLAARACRAETSAAILAHHRSQGAAVHLSAQVVGVAARAGRAGGIVLSDGAETGRRSCAGLRGGRAERRDCAGCGPGVRQWHPCR